MIIRIPRSTPIRSRGVRVVVVPSRPGSLRNSLEIYICIPYRIMYMADTAEFQEDILIILGSIIYGNREVEKAV